MEQHELEKQKKEFLSRIKKEVKKFFDFSCFQPQSDGFGVVECYLDAEWKRPCNEPSFHGDWQLARIVTDDNSENNIVKIQTWKCLEKRVSIYGGQRSFRSHDYKKNKNITEQEYNKIIETIVDFCKKFPIKYTLLEC